jgi:catechol 2,3-dioxygenase-like lactoylglutathione lyase family enzyme
MSHGDALHYDGHAASRAASGPQGLGFSHLTLEVSDLDRSEAWYRDVIGLDLLGRDLMAEDRPHAVLQLATGQCLVLLQVDHPAPRRPNSTSIHHAFYLTMDQFRAAQARLSAAGYDIADNRAAFRARGEYSFDVSDPDDHRWQVQAFGPEQHELIKPDAGVVDCGPAEQFAVGSVTVFRDGNFFLVRAPEGLLALSRWCQHANGLLAYQCEHWRFYCAFHGATYTTYGDHTGHLPNVPPLRLNPITLTDDGRVLVDTNVVIERRPDEPPPFTAVPVAESAAAPA